MKLHWSPRSPFVRKVMIVAHEKGLTGRLDCVRSVVAYAAAPNEEVLRDNPLGKIPALVLDDGTCLFDSPVICEYLDGLDGRPTLLPKDGAGRWAQLRWQALGDGMTDILLLWRNEQMRPGGEYAVVVKAFDRKIRASFAQLNAEARLLSDMPFGLGHIAIICAIGQLDFRFRDSHWRDAFPVLAAWYDKVGARDSVARSAPQDDPSPVAVDPAFDPNSSPINFLEVRPV